VKRWILPFALAFAALLVVGLPLRVRLDSPRLGASLVLGPGASGWIECRSSLPWLPSAWVLRALQRD
jgi:hypothetical protein